MTIAKSPRPLRVQLDCGHELWLRPPRPRNGDTIWCTKCGQGVMVGPSVAAFGRQYFPDYNWTCEGVTGVGFVGECHENDCGETFVHRYDWRKTQDKIISHYMREHTNSEYPIDIEIVPLPLDGNPPF